MELVSIIMAAYNAAETIEKAVLSVITQTYQNWELLIIDDCSRDDTMRIMREYAGIDNRIRVFVNESNLGVSRTRKRGLHEAKGQWIAILDSDDAWEADKLEKQMALLTNTETDLVYTGSAFMDNSGKRLNWILHVPDTMTYRDLLKQNRMSNSSIIVRKELYQQYYVTGDYMHEDYAIWLQMLRAGHVVSGIDEPLLIYRLANSSKTSNKLKSARMQWKTYRHIGLHPVSSVYYMCCYTVRGFIKYRNLKNSGHNKGILIRSE